MTEDRSPYYSWGNGAAMRVSPCGWVMSCEYYCKTGYWPVQGQNIAKRSAAVTHNHPEGIKGAMAVADAIFICRLFRGRYIVAAKPVISSLKDCKNMVRQWLEKRYGYDLSRTLDIIRPTYQFDESCQGTVPQAVTAFLESTDFEDAIRNAISLGGDSDTLATITGSIAEAAYGVPQWIVDKAWEFLDEPLRDVCRKWRMFLT